MATWMSTKYKCCANIAKKRHDKTTEWLNFWFFSIPRHSTLTLFGKNLTDKHEMQQTSSHQKLQCPPCTLLFTHSIVLPWTILSFHSFFGCFFFLFFLTCDVLSSWWHESKTNTHTQQPRFFPAFCQTRQTCFGNEVQTNIYNKLNACLLSPCNITE